MAPRRVRIHRELQAPNGLQLESVFQQIRAELQIPAQFPAQVLAAAAAAAQAPKLPELDRTDLPFFTIDPIGSRDLDQAMHLTRSGRGFTVYYAIADIMAFIAPGSPLDAESRRRGQTLYAPDLRTPLHPPILSEDVASLLPGQVRPAFLWELKLDEFGELRSANVERSLVRSVERLDYESVQQQLESGSTDERFILLRQIGELRSQLEAARGGASLPMPEQEIDVVRGHYRTHLRPASPVEGWNAQISLLTGMAAADLMLAGHIGILRTMPGPAAAAIATYRRQVSALGLRWSAEQSYGHFLRTLDGSQSPDLAVIHAAVGLFRGAGYTPFEGAPPETSEHAAVADQYAHVTAPLRRLVDRFGLEICAALCRDSEVPGWVRQALPELPGLMRSSDQQARQLDRRAMDAVEAAILSQQVGEEFAAIVVDVSGSKGGLVQLIDPAVLAFCNGSVTLGSAIRVCLKTADVASRTVEFTVA